MNQLKTCLFSHLYFLLICGHLSHFLASSEVTVVKICADSNCKAPVSKGRTVSGYPSNSKDVLSFKINQEVIIYGKLKDIGERYWDVEIAGKRGLAPHIFIREEEVFVKSPKSEVKLTDDLTFLPGEKKKNEGRVTVEIGKKGDNRDGHGSDREEKELVRKIPEEEEDMEQKLSEVTPIANVESNVIVESDSNNNNNNVMEVTSDEMHKDKANDDDDVTHDGVFDDDTITSEDRDTADVEEGEKEEEEEDEDEESDLHITKEEADDEIDDDENSSGYITSDDGDDKLNSLGKIEMNRVEKISENILGATMLNSDTESSDKASSGSDKTVAEDKLETVEKAPEKHVTDYSSFNFDTHAGISDSVLVTDSLSVSSVVQASSDKVDMTSSITIVDGTTIHGMDSDLFEPVTTESFYNSIEESTNDFSVTPPLLQKFTNEPMVNKLLPTAVPEVIKQESLGEKIYKNDATERDVVMCSDSQSSESCTHKSESKELVQAELEVTSEADESGEVDKESDAFGMPRPESVLSTSEPSVSSSSGKTTEDYHDQSENEIVESTGDSQLGSCQSKKESCESVIPAPVSYVNVHGSSSRAKLSDEAVGYSSGAEGTTEFSDSENAKEDGLMPSEQMLQSTEDFHFHENNDMESIPSLTDHNKEDVGDGESVSDDSQTLLQRLLIMVRPVLGDEMMLALEAELAHPKMSSGSLVFLLVLAGTIVFSYTVHLVFVKLSREGPLLKTMNEVDRLNRLAKQENAQLKQKLVELNVQLKAGSCQTAPNSESIAEHNEKVASVQSEYEIKRQELEEKILQLESELEESSASGLEMHKMLDELLNSQKDTSLFQASVDSLQSMLDRQREKVEVLNSDLSVKTRMNEQLQNELKLSQEKVMKLEFQIDQVTCSLEEVNTTKSSIHQQLQEQVACNHQLQQSNSALTQHNQDAAASVAQLSSELSTLKECFTQLNDSLSLKQAELQISKECLKKLQLMSKEENGLPDEEKLRVLFDVIELKSQLKFVSSKRDQLQHRLTETTLNHKGLENSVEALRTQVEELRSLKKEAVKEKEEALGRLKVLTEYFREKEEQLAKELESQEGLRLTAEGSATETARKIQGYEFELATYKTQITNLQKELQDQEQSYKAQLSSQELKAHENWLASRANERKHEELKQENSHLRNRLLLMQREKEDSILKTSKRIEVNGSLSSPPSGVGGTHHSGPPSREMDSPNQMPLLPPPPLLPHLFPPHPGAPPLPPGMPLGMPPPLPPPGMPPFLPPPPLHERRLPPTGGMSPPHPFRHHDPISPAFNRHVFSPVSSHSVYSDHRRFSPEPRPHNDHRRFSPEPRPHNDHMPNHRPSSPSRWTYNRSPDGYTRQMSPNSQYYDDPDCSSGNHRLPPPDGKGQKTSTPLGASQL